MVTEQKMRSTAHKLNAALNKLNGAIRDAAAIGLTIKLQSKTYEKIGPSFGAPQVNVLLGTPGPEITG